jgi:hypothetical protein
VLRLVAVRCGAVRCVAVLEMKVVVSYRIVHLDELLRSRRLVDLRVILYFVRFWLSRPSLLGAILAFVVVVGLVLRKERRNTLLIP